jgi:antitoxin FitA
VIVAHWFKWRRRGNEWIQIGGDLDPLPVNLSIKNAPDDVVIRLRQRAERHHRSLQGELLAIIEEAVRSERDLSPAELVSEVRRLGLRTPAESAAIVRADRDRG